VRVLDVGTLDESHRDPRLGQRVRVCSASLEVRLHCRRDRPSHTGHSQDRLEDAVGATLFFSPDLESTARGQFGGDPFQSTTYGVASLIDSDVGEIDRQKGVRSPIEAVHKLDIPVCDQVGPQRVSDAFPEVIDGADQPLFSKTVGTRERVL